MSTSRSHTQGQPPQPHVPLITMRPLAPASYIRQNNVESNAVANAKQQMQQLPPPPRLKPPLSGESLRETSGKEMPNFKGNFQNSISEVNFSNE